MDLDILVDYQCLMNKIYPLNGLYLLQDPNWVYTNGFFYVDQAKNKELEKLINKTIYQLDSIPQGVSTGPWPYKDYDFLKTAPGINSCLIHQFDETWN